LEFLLEFIVELYNAIVQHDTYFTGCPIDSRIPLGYL